MNKKIKSYTAMFHNTYEILAPKFGYETRGDTKQLDFDSPNGKLMYATVEKVVYPILKENQQLKNIINKANKKIDNMFDVGDENKIIDDLLELQKILDNKGSDK